jgi:hypothetical protein
MSMSAVQMIREPALQVTTQSWRDAELLCVRVECWTVFKPLRRGQSFCSLKCGRTARRGRDLVVLTERELETIEWWLCELETTHFEVVLIPSQDDPGRMLRAVAEANPEWYREFCAAHTRVKPGRRRAQTFISKKRTLTALERLLEGDMTSLYARRLLALVRRKIGGVWKRSRLTDSDTSLSRAA